MVAEVSPREYAPITWVDGVRSHSLNTLDRGLAYGDGLFETMRFQAGKVQLLPWHWRRLLQGAERLGIPLKEADLANQFGNVLTDITNEQVELNGPEVGFGVLKLIVTRGIGQGYQPTTNHKPTAVWFYRTAIEQSHFRQNGVGLSVSPIRLSRSLLLGGLKHLNRLEYVMAGREPNLPLDHQWLLLDENGSVVESLTHNVFWITEGVLCTPDVSFCGVAGVMRQWIIERAAQLGLSVRITEYKLADVESADEIFICNSLRGIWPVTQIQHVHFNPGPITRQFQCAIDQFWQQ